MEIKIRILKQEDDRSLFSCGEIALDYYFQRYAGQNQFKHYIGTTYVATDDTIVFGFASVSAGTLLKRSLTPSEAKEYPNYPLPIMRVTRIAVDKKHQNQGIGKYLMKTMFHLSLEQKEKFGCVGIVVDAKSDAVQFYKKLGFVELEVEQGDLNVHPPQTAMFISTKTVEKAITFKIVKN